MSRRTPLGPPLVIRNSTHRGQEGRDSTSRARSSSSSGCLPARCGLIALRVETAVLRMATGGIPPRRVIWSTSASRASSSLRRLAQHWICFALAFRLRACFVTVATMCSKIATSPMVSGPAPGREEEALRAHADVGEGLQQACRNRPLRVSRRTLGKEALDTGLEGTLEGLQIDEEVLLKRRRLEMGDEAKSATHSRAHALRARALCKRALLRRAGGSAHVRSFANARTHFALTHFANARSCATHSLRAHALCKSALLRHALTPAISSTSVPHALILGHALTPAISSTSVPAPRRRDAATDTCEAEACETDT
jgi:hypothetical protein